MRVLHKWQINKTLGDNRKILLQYSFEEDFHTDEDENHSAKDIDIHTQASAYDMP